MIAVVCYRKRRTHKKRNEKEENIHLLPLDIPPFYKTSIFHKANAFLKDGGKILCLIGEWGSGKSTMAKEVYMSRTGRTPVVIEDILKFDVSTCQDSFIVEEPLPRESISDKETRDIVEKMISLCKQIQTSNDIFLIITSTEEAWGKITGKIKDCVEQSNDLCCLDINYKSLTNADLMQILHTIFEHYNPDTPFTNVEKAASKMSAESFGFPEICTLLSRCKEFQNSPVVFLNRPLRYLSLYLENMTKSPEGKEKFAIMVFMSVNDMKIDVNELNEKLRKIFRTCGLNADKKVQLQKILPLEFVLQVDSSVYVLQHEIIKRITLITFGKFYFSDLLKFSSKKDLVGWIKLKKTHIFTKLLDGTQQASDIEPVLEINEEQWIEYLKKMESTSQPTCEKSDITNDKHNIDL
ncbi:uncharacterized protein LOC134274542 [Saccostrea cucullata]|uniref:uncharacterized protein LOC134274542 n=1 Tax=Saccostrea cuccullata TaxID=36930 RepID=UPI002ED00C5B